jgi:hypothetical protein
MPHRISSCSAGMLHGHSAKAVLLVLPTWRCVCAGFCCSLLLPAGPLLTWHMIHSQARCRKGLQTDIAQRKSQVLINNCRMLAASKGASIRYT